MMNNFFLFVLLLMVLNGCQNDKPSPPWGKLSEEDVAKLPKTYFEFDQDSLTENLEITWINDTSIIAKIAYDSSDIHSTFASYLGEKYPNSDYETYDDTLGESHPMREFTLVQRKPNVNLSLKISTDTSFAVLINWNMGPGESNQLTNRIMYFKK